MVVVVLLVQVESAEDGRGDRAQREHEHEDPDKDARLAGHLHNAVGDLHADEGADDGPEADPDGVVHVQEPVQVVNQASIDRREKHEEHASGSRNFWMYAKCQKGWVVDRAAAQAEGAGDETSHEPKPG